jgi:hypothetical protein
VEPYAAKASARRCISNGPQFSQPDRQCPKHGRGTSSVASHGTHVTKSRGNRRTSLSLCPHVGDGTARRRIKMYNRLARYIPPAILTCLLLLIISSGRRAWQSSPVALATPAHANDQSTGFQDFDSERAMEESLRDIANATLGVSGASRNTMILSASVGMLTGPNVLVRARLCRWLE